MSYFPDLSPYTYFEGEDGVLNVGWIDAQHAFPIWAGGEESEFKEKLKAICAVSS